MNNLLLQVQIFLRARYPILYLISHEEDRVVRAMKKVSTTEKMKLVVWNSTFGIEGEKQTKTPLQLLNYIDKNTEPTMFVLLDFHQYIEDKKHARWLRDLSKKIVVRKQAIIILAPRMIIPEELEKLVTTFNNL